MLTIANRIGILLALALVVTIACVSSLGTGAKPRARAIDAAPQAESPAKPRLEVRLLSADATYTMSRLELVGAQIQFDLSLRIGATVQVNRWAFQLGGSSNAWDETRKALQRSLEAFPKGGARYVLWAGLDPDQWWDSPDAAGFLRGIPASPLETR